MDNIRMIVNDGHKDAVLTATSEETGLEIENTQNIKRAYPWRSTNATAQTITAVMPITANGGGIVLVNTNISDAATVQVALKNGATTLDTISLACLGDNLDGTRTWHAWFDEDPVDQYELTITDTGNADGYIQIQHIMCGPYLSPEINFNLGGQMEWLEDVEHITTKGQSLRSIGTRAIRRQFALQLEWLEETGRAALVSGLLEHGMVSPIFVSLYPNAGGTKELHQQFVCKRMGPIQHDHWAPMFWRQPLQFREV